MAVRLELPSADVPQLPASPGGGLQQDYWEFGGGEQHSFGAALSAFLVHELRQPLTAIRINAKAALRLLSDSQSGDTALTHTISQLYADTERAGKIITGMLDLANGQRHDDDTVNVLDAIYNVKRILSSQLTRAEVHVAIHAPRIPIFVAASDIHLEQLIYNLASNAIEAMLRFDSCRTLNIRSGVSGQWGVISVSDTGPGIPANIRKQIFAPQFTTREGRFGMGLAICRSIAILYGGNICLTRATRGAVFRVRLPLAR